jgi:hypothetical protein
LILANLQVVSLFLAQRLLVAWHRSSSSDPVADGFEILVKEAVLTGSLVLLAIVLTLILASWSLWKVNAENAARPDSVPKSTT